VSESLSRAIHTALVSPNEPDRNFEPANVVDASAQAGRNIAGALDSVEIHGVVFLEAADRIAFGLGDVATAINELAAAVREARA